MGYGAELLADYAFEIDYPFGIAGKYWITKDKRKLLMTEMSESHITNCMKLVGEDDEWYEVFQKELLRRERNQ
jgi:hypothetical protein